MALAALQRLEPAGPVWSCHVLWAGDSRVYVFEPEDGAHQLTTDDVRDRGDAMANLREDSVVSNAMSADTPFVVHHRQVELTAPFLLVAATDGCFGYVRSPMHFERLLLRTLRASVDTPAWSEALQGEISAVTGDDAAMALLGVGADHDGFKALFEARAAEVETEITAPIDRLDAEVDRVERQLEELRHRQAEEAAEAWSRYKPGYERYLAEGTEGQAS
jgi:hypothetical protein